MFSSGDFAGEGGQITAVAVFDASWSRDKCNQPPSRACLLVSHSLYLPLARAPVMHGRPRLVQFAVGLRVTHSSQQDKDLMRATFMGCSDIQLPQMSHDMVRRSIPVLPGRRLILLRIPSLFIKTFDIRNPGVAAEGVGPSVMLACDLGQDIPPDFLDGRAGEKRVSCCCLHQSE